MKYPEDENKERDLFRDLVKYWEPEQRYYNSALDALREHFKACNCFLPYTSCWPEIDELREKCAEYYHG